jgi:serine carboxypeptidase 1
MFAALAFASLAAVASATSAIPDQDWGYVVVRPGAHMFWWLYGSTSSSSPLPREQQPIALWLQGGPGGSSIGYGDFQELGPLDMNLQPRNTTWVQAANVLFLDQPVGTGWSYVDDDSLLTTSNQQIADDVLTLLQAFMAAYPAFQTAPFFIFSESYGGKMTVSIANTLLAAKANGKININLRGVALGDSWISGVDYVNTWGPLLRAFSEMTEQENDDLSKRAAAPCQAAVDAGNWSEATNYWGKAEGIIDDYSCVNFYNILQTSCADHAERQRVRALPRNRLSPEALALAPPGIDADALQALYSRHVGLRSGDPVDDLMNGPIRAYLNNGTHGKVINDSVVFDSQGGKVFSALSGDFMRPVLAELDQLLSGAQINVTVYHGQIDLICSSMGSEAWMHKLQWPGMAGFYATPKTRWAPWEGSDITGAIRKSFYNTGPGGDGGALSLWYVMMAGHMVPEDNGDAALRMFSTILSEQSGL